VSLGLYMDEHVHSAITNGLRDRGVDVLTVQEDGRSGADDPAVLDRAMVLIRVVFTRDADFLVEASRRQRAGEAFAGVIYAHLMRASIGRCVDDLELIAGASELDEFANRLEFLPL
jgi:hypothetical protein